MRGRITISVAALSVVATVVLAAAASGQPRGTPRAATITLQLRSHLEHVQLVDNAPTGRSAGDMLIFTERLQDTRGQQIGSDAASCVFLFDQRSLCTATYILPRGQVMVQLLQPSLSGKVTYTQAITGGTGRFARATGTVTVNQQPAGDHFTFHIHLPS